MNRALTPITHLLIYIPHSRHPSFQSTGSLVQVSQARWKYSPDSFAMCMPHRPRMHPMSLKFQQSSNIDHEIRLWKRGNIRKWCITWLLLWKSRSASAALETETVLVVFVKDRGWLQWYTVINPQPEAMTQMEKYLPTFNHPSRGYSPS